MQKIKKVVKTASASQPAIRPAKPTQTSSKTGSRKRKPLTKAQRERKNAHDRAVRAAKRAANKADNQAQKPQELRKGQVYSLERPLPLRGALPVRVGTVFTVGEYFDSVEKFDFGIGGTCSIPSEWIEAALREGCLYLVDDPNPEAIPDPEKRAVACAKADAAEKDRAKRVCRRAGEVCVPETPCNAGRTGCSTGMQGTCGGCGPTCVNYDKCHHLARTSGFPRLHQAKDAVEAANREAAANPVRKPDSACNPIASIGAWVRDNIERLERTKGTGIARRTFAVPGGVAEVSVCRRSCEYPRRTVVALPFRVTDPREWFTPGFWNAIAGLSFRPLRSGAAVDFNDGLVIEQARRGLTWEGEAPDPS